MTSNLNDLPMIRRRSTPIQHPTIVSERDPEIARKVVHIGTGNVILLAWWLQFPTWVGVGASILFSILTAMSYVWPILPGINGVGRRSWGTFFYAVSIGLLIAWFWPLGLPQFAALGVLFMTWGDGLAGVIGKTWGTHRYQLWGMEKSWEGTATMAGVSFVIALAILGLTVTGPWGSLLLLALGLGLVAAGLEAFSKLGLDNLTVPLGCAAIAWALVQGLQLTPVTYFG